MTWTAPSPRSLRCSTLGGRVRFVLSRRAFLRATGAAGLYVALPVSATGCYGPPGEPEVFTGDERRMLAALADAVLPPDDTPGGSDLGTVEYLERLLGGMNQAVPPIFAGGPYSGRAPFGDGVGGVSSVYPENDFENFIPLDRVSLAAWRLRILGSAGVAGGGPNDEALGPVTGLRDRVKEILGRALGYEPDPDSLDADGRAKLLARLDQDSIDMLVDIVSQAAFSAPEYGGNRDLGGWKLCHFEGDVQPLGYSFYDLRTQTYRERPGHPVSTPNTSDPEPMDSDTIELVRTAVLFLGGEEF
jgi:hypothetical protein